MNKKDKRREKLRKDNKIAQELRTPKYRLRRVEDKTKLYERRTKHDILNIFEKEYKDD